MHEIITLQLGQRSNYLGTHFWNAQESYFTYSSNEESPIDHDVHFRPGIGVDGGETFTPRTVIYDLKGGFGSLRKVNALYGEIQDSNPAGQWAGAVSTVREEPIKPHVYQESLEAGVSPPQLTTDTVRYWSDFNRPFYHPKSIVQLNDYELNSTLRPFESWTSGEELFGNLDKEHDLLDRDLRPFAEECDQIQALQIMTSVDDAWGGFAAQYLDRLRDEYGKTTLWVWGLEDSRKVPRAKKMLRSANVVRSLSDVSGQASTYVPLSVPVTQLPSDISMSLESDWHTSALLSTAMESITVLARVKSSQGRVTLDQLEANLNLQGNRTISRLKCSIADEEEYNRRYARDEQEDDRRSPRNANIISANDMEDSRFELGFLPEQSKYRKKDHIFAQTEVLRGNFKIPDESSGEADYERKHRRIAGLSVVEKHQICLQFPLVDSFPKIFPNIPQHSSSIAVRGALATSTDVANYIKNVKSRINPFIALEERENLSNRLEEMIEAYEEGYISESEEDDDDL
ncbi:MAG: Protein misato 1 [Cirrosporium novae-zelandiae]|nr:MAG: Protein misato 1 [Cirrosporium novae-zelandiae]